MHSSIGTLRRRKQRPFLRTKLRATGLRNPSNLEEKAISLIGRPLYEAFIRGYTQKQWETDPKLLPPDIITRLPVRLNYNDFYFSDRFEGIPCGGYTRVFERMLDHSKITVLTSCDFSFISGQISPKAIVVYTGPIDAFFNFRLGRLGWRTLDFELDRPLVADFQGTSVMNYADVDVKFTKSTNSNIIIRSAGMMPERR